MSRSTRHSFWTHELRKKVFVRLLNEFGPHRTWGNARSPQGKARQYKIVLAELAAEISTQLGRAVKSTAVGQQVDWGITKQIPMRDQARVRSFILNKAAALEAGMISTSDLPFLLTSNSN